MRTSYRLTWRCAFVAAFALYTVALGFSQSAKPASSPAHLRYAFSNFVWWSDDELYTLLKERLPDLGDEIAPTKEAEGRVREALKVLLKEKGIVADVLSEDPSGFSLTAERAPGAPPPAVVFSILSPTILVDKVVISQAPTDLINTLNETVRPREGREYSSRQDWLVRSNAKEQLESRGYLESVADVSHDAPRRDGDHYVVNLLVSVKPGPQYRISAITADGGPLLKGRDLSASFTEKSGDVAGPDPFGRLAGQLRALYWHNGYADVEIQGPPVFDHEHALVSYHLTVIPGPLYRLRSVSVQNLSADQERKARELLGMKPGDVFDEMAINDLSHKLISDTLMKPYGFTFRPAKNRPAATVDLSLDFYRLSDKGSVTVH